VPMFVCFVMMNHNYHNYFSASDNETQTADRDTLSPVSVHGHTIMQILKYK
jgi:hypothetical protein